MLALSNLVPEILASIQGQMQLKQEGDFGEGSSVFVILSDILLDSSWGKLKHSIKYFMCVYNQTKEQLTAHDHLKTEQFLFSNLMTAFSLSKTS